MIVCRSRKFIFLRVPKTASTSLSVHIVKNTQFTLRDFYSEMPTGLIDSFNIPHSIYAKDQHPNLEKFLRCGLLDESTISSCRIYGVLRNPIDRFFSHFTQIVSFFNNIDVSEIDNNDLAIEAFKILEKSKNYLIEAPHKLGHSIPCMPQSNWLVHNQKPIQGILIYPHFENFIKEITGNDNLEKINVGERNIKPHHISKTTIRNIHSLYAEDFELWRKFTGEILYS